jgi:hypothetical protein
MSNTGRNFLNGKGLRQTLKPYAQDLINPNE